MAVDGERAVGAVQIHGGPRIQIGDHLGGRRRPFKRIESLRHMLRFRVFLGSDSTDELEVVRQKPGSAARA